MFGAGPMFSPLLWQIPTALALLVLLVLVAPWLSGRRR